MSRTSWKVMMITPFRLSALLVLLGSTGFPVLNSPVAAADDGTVEYVMHGDADMADEELIESQGVFSGVSTYSRSLVRRLPVDRGWAYDSPIDKSIKRMFHSSKLKLEYLNWTLRGPDEVLLGTPIEGVIDSTQPSTAFDRKGGSARGIGVELDFNDKRMHTNGMRGSLEFALPEGSLEWNVWGTFKNTSIRPTDNIFATLTTPDPDDDLVVLTNFTIDGEPASNTNVYDTSYTVTLNTEMVGTGVNYIMDSYLPGEGFRVQPMYGFRYINLNESLNQVGVDSVHSRTTTIYSKSENRVYGPSIGARAEIRQKRFIVGAEPKFTFGFNRNTNQVATEQLFEPSDPRIVSIDKNNEFSPIFQVTVYAKLNLTEHMRCFVGYDYLYIGQLSRAFNIIEYNQNTNASNPAVGTRVRDDNSRFSAEGLSAGLEFIW